MAHRLSGTVLGDGRIRIPNSIRKELGLQKGTKVIFEMRQGSLVVIPAEIRPRIVANGG